MATSSLRVLYTVARLTSGTPAGGGVHLLGAQMDVLPLERADDSTALGSDPPSPGLQTVGQAGLAIRDAQDGGRRRHLSRGVP